MCPIIIEDDDNVIRTHFRGRFMKVALDKNKFKKYPIRKSKMENVCGQYLCQIASPVIPKVSVRNKGCMGWQDEMYNIYGNGLIMNSKDKRVFFKGCKNYKGAKLLARDLCLPNPPICVHMTVISACLGMLVDVSPGGLAYFVLQKLHMDPYHVPDCTNAIRFHLNFKEALPKTKITPKKNDWTITTRGCVIIRMTWDALSWTQAMEDEVVEFCDMYVEHVKEHIKTMV